MIKERYVTILDNIVSPFFLAHSSIKMTVHRRITICWQRTDSNKINLKVDWSTRLWGMTTTFSRPDTAWFLVVELYERKSSLAWLQIKWRVKTNGCNCNCSNWNDTKFFKFCCRCRLCRRKWCKCQTFALVLRSIFSYCFILCTFLVYDCNSQ